MLLELRPVNLNHLLGLRGEHGHVPLDLADIAHERFFAEESARPHVTQVLTVVPDGDLAPLDQEETVLRGTTLGEDGVAAVVLDSCEVDALHGPRLPGPPIFPGLYLGQAAHGSS